MKTHLLLFALLLCTVATSSRAQVPRPASEESRPRRGRRPMPVQSPEVAADGRVTFRLRAADASEVVVAGQWPDGRVAMTKNDNGVWQVTAGPIEPGVWEYSFRVNGLSMIDPGNPAIKPMRQPRTSILHLPGAPPRVHDFQDVPHGVVHQHTYRSKSLGRIREVAVYTPPSYDKQSGARFPTLYLQHGRGDNQATWTVHGKAHWILDNLISQDRALPMLIVMMNGHAATTSSGAGGFQGNTQLFERDLLEDVMPLVEANYRVKTDAASRAIVGLSMGGGQSLTIGLNHADRFAWVGGFSSAVPSEEAIAGALEEAEATDQKLKLLWIGCGKDDFLLRRNEEFVARLKEKQLDHEWHLTEGNHSWPIWRTYLTEFVPRLFR